MGHSIISELATIGPSTLIYDFVNIYGACTIGEGCIIGAFVEIQPGVIIGDKVKVSSHTFICDGVTLEDESFVGHGVMFTNDRYPKSVYKDGSIVTAASTLVQPILVGKRAAIGSGSVILAGVSIGPSALVGAGSVVTRDVPANALVTGNPARLQRYLSEDLM